MLARTFSRPSFDDAFAGEALVAAMLAFEAGLARAQAAEGLIPGEAATVIEHACAQLPRDVDAWIAQARRSASLAVPLVNALRARLGTPHAEYVHFGATSQDVLDTAMVICLRTCLEEADRSLAGAVRGLAVKAREHRATPMLGRTLLQPALPIPAGLKIARWAAALAQDRERLAEAAAAGLAVQLGGPVGALDALGPKGPAVRHRLAMALGLADARAWHTHRNAWIDLLDRVAQVVLTAGKIARDLALLSQPEVGEMLEVPSREDRGRSSSMPHKRNPVACAHALAAATVAPGLLAALHASGIAEHERALGGWQAEWLLVPQLAGALGTSLDFLDTIATSLVVDAVRMKVNAVAYGAPAPPASLEAAVDELLAELAPHLA
ncbi:MAG TPA: lyase family protein [Usitatibacter sp.]|nr:lyase family protein [Usitatibacter sp.]